jgi:hypothetical protein
VFLCVPFGKENLEPQGAQRNTEKSA